MKAKARHKKAVTRLLERERKSWKPPIIKEKPLTKVVKLYITEEIFHVLDPIYTEHMQDRISRELAKCIMKNHHELLRIERQPDYTGSNTILSFEMEIVVPKSEPIHHFYAERISMASIPLSKNDNKHIYPRTKMQTDKK